MRLLLALTLVAAGPAIHHTSADTQAARSSLLTTKNLGKGWTSTPSPQQGVRFTCRGYDPSGAGIVETGAASSPTFARGSGATLIQIVQKASVYRTAAQANAYWRRAVKPGLATCAAQTLEAVESQGVKVKGLVEQSLRISSSSAKATGYRVHAMLKTSSNSVKAFLDVLVIESGRTITTVTITSLVTGPPLAFEEILVHDVVSNMGGPAA